MQIFSRWINKIKSDMRLFQFLATKLYKFFNVVDRNDLIKYPNSDKIYRIVDMYDNGSFDVVCDDDLSPMREKWNGRVVLVNKYFKRSHNYRSAKHDNGWRFFGGGFYNFKTKEILQRKEKGSVPCK